MSQSSELQQIQRRTLQAVVEVRLLGEDADLQIATILYNADRTAALNSYRSAADTIPSRVKC
ncbi:hypothetical protein D6T64_03300 [Cryobacterium melibiosiphilum]|uniref:Uncharacterized protein n=1 Tax=Cryobacterium melibiosiphilum TaxID=995039 RepID=A0A3A5MN36_9MICO|nr:hypothetical protein [Cryobacterium melibiosiphilum]RJT90772.1 hypothetical protein D6T64_03300 [Cryobacterium melibiosiphilum]